MGEFAYKWLAVVAYTRGERVAAWGVVFKEPTGQEDRMEFGAGAR